MPCRSGSLPRILRASDVNIVESLTELPLVHPQSDVSTWSVRVVHPPRLGALNYRGYQSIMDAIGDDVA